MEKLSSIFSTIENANEKIAKFFSFLIILMVVFQVGEVILRYGLRSPTIWIWEFVMMLYAVHFVIGGSWVLIENRHVRTDIIYERLSEKGKAIADMVFFGILFFSFFFIMLWQYGGHVINSWTIQETTWSMWRAPIYPLKTIVWVGFLMMAIQGIIKWIRDFIFVIKGERV